MANWMRRHLLSGAFQFVLQSMEGVQPAIRHWNDPLDIKRASPDHPSELRFQLDRAIPVQSYLKHILILLFVLQAAIQSSELRVLGKVVLLFSFRLRPLLSRWFSCFG